MPLLPEMSELIRSRQSSQPRTILGFLIGMSSLVTTGAVVGAIALIRSGAAALGVVVLGVGALILTGVIIAVIRQAQKDPAGLMLGQITGAEYEAIRRLTMGDSSHGERVETFASGGILEGQVTASTAEVEPVEELPADG